MRISNFAEPKKDIICVVTKVRIERVVLWARRSSARLSGYLLTHISLFRFWILSILKWYLSQSFCWLTSASFLLWLSNHHRLWRQPIPSHNRFSYRDHVLWFSSCRIRKFLSFKGKLIHIYVFSVIAFLRKQEKIRKLVTLITGWQDGRNILIHSHTN